MLTKTDGVTESGLWLAQRGLGRYGSRTTGRSLQDRRTRPIQREYHDAVVEVGKCLGCSGTLAFRRNPRGGSYFACKDGGHDCYYIGMNPKTGWGYELIAEKAGAVPLRKAG